MPRDIIVNEATPFHSHIVPAKPLKRKTKMLLYIVGAIVLFFIIKFAVSSGISAKAREDAEFELLIADIEKEKQQKKLGLTPMKQMEQRPTKEVKLTLTEEQQTKLDLFHKQVEATAKKQTAT